jgi:AraC-like DNA-binding protein
VFSCKVRFGQPRYAFVFPRAYLDITQPHSDETVHQVLRSNADVLLRERESESVAERVRAILRYEPDVARVDVRRIATQLGMNVRALRRRLGAEQAPLSSLLDEARLRVARTELRKPGASIKEVAHGLGFSEASAFHRAFKRWSGETPAQYVKETLSHATNTLDAATRA